MKRLKIKYERLLNKHSSRFSFRPASNKIYLKCRVFESNFKMVNDHWCIILYLQYYVINCKLTNVKNITKFKPIFMGWARWIRIPMIRRSVQYFLSSFSRLKISLYVIYKTTILLDILHENLTRSVALRYWQTLRIVIYIYIVAYKPVARQLPRNEQRYNSRC